MVDILSQVCLGDRPLNLCFVDRCVHLAFFLASVPMQSKQNLRTLSENIKCIYTRLETEKKSRQCTCSQSSLKRSSL